MTAVSFDAFDIAPDADPCDKAAMAVMRAAFNCPNGRDLGAVTTLCHAVLIHTKDLDTRDLKQIVAGLAGSLALAARREAEAKELLESQSVALDAHIEMTREAARKNARKLKKAKAQIRQLKSQKRKS